MESGGKMFVQKNRGKSAAVLYSKNASMFVATKMKFTFWLEFDSTKLEKNFAHFVVSLTSDG
jgi:hypothetical protein